MNKTLRNLGLGLALLAGIETITLPYTVQAQETAKKGLLQVVIDNNCPYNVGAIISIDGRRLLGCLDKSNSPLLLKLNYDMYIIGVRGATNPYDGFRDSFQGNDVVDQRAIEINHPTSRLEIIIDYDENIGRGHVYFGDFSNFFDRDNDSFLDDVEQFFGTNDNASNDSPAIRPNIRVRKEGRDFIFYTNNFNYIPTFSEAKTIEEDMQAYDNKVKQMEDQNESRNEEIESLIYRSRNKPFFYTWQQESADYQRLQYLHGEYIKIEKQIQGLEEEKDKRYNEFYPNSNMFRFEREGNSLKIFYKKYEDETWQDVTDQPGFYKDLD